MNFKNKENDIEKILKEVFEDKKELIKKTNELYKYIDPEFFDNSYRDDEEVSKLIKKRLHVIKNLILNKIKKLNDDNMELEFFSTKFTHEAYEPIIYLYGNIPGKKLKIKTIPQTISEEKSFFIVIDFINGYKLLPWS